MYIYTFYNIYIYIYIYINLNVLDKQKKVLKAHLFSKIFHFLCRSIVSLINLRKHQIKMNTVININLQKNIKLQKS